MKKSKYDGQAVTYVDHFLLAHTGRIVGQSDDGKTYFVQSNHKGVKPAPFHFTVAAAILPAVLAK